MIAALLLAFREGLEAALILGIVLGVLKRVNRSDGNRAVWLGAGLAALLSLVAGVALYGLDIAFEGTTEQLFEGFAMLFAAAMLTWMILWMNRQGRNIQSELEQGVKQAASGKRQHWTLFSLAFVAILREGVELALFLTAASFTSTANSTLVGATIGLAAAAIAGWLLFATTTRLNLGRFFQVTGLLLIIFAAGLVAHGVHEFNEAGLIPALIDPVWDINPILDENSNLGEILKALVGYNGNPSLSEVIAYLAYWSALVLAVRPQRLPAGQRA